jgi:hypothetical protein
MLQQQEEEQARKVLNFNTLPSNSTSPDEDKRRIVHLVYQLPSNANEITLSNKIAEIR